MAGPDPCRRIQDEVEQIDQEIQDLIDLLPDIPVKQRPGILRRIATLRRQEHNLQAELNACHRDPDPFLLQLDGIEVVQAIQRLDNAVPLVAGKATVARVYLSYYGSAAITVRGTLRGDGTAGPGALVGSQRDTVLDPARAGDTAAKRRDAALSLNFVLPLDLLFPGVLTLTLDSITDVGTGQPRAVAYNASVRVTFDAAHPLRVRVLTVRYSQQVQPAPAPPTSFVPTAGDLQHLRSWLGRAYPVAQVIWSTAAIDANRPAPFTSGDVNAQLAAIRAQDVGNGLDKRTHYYGMVADGGFFMRGSAAGIPATADPSTVAAGPTGTGTWGWDFDGSYGDWYGGHELGHTFGRFHPGSGCGESSDDPNYPYQHGQLADTDASFVGFDAGDPALGIAMAAYPGTTWHDVMTYCNFQWPSDYTYKGIKARLADEDALAAGPIPAAAPVAAPAAPAGGRPDQRFPERTAVAERNGQGRQQMLVSVVAAVDLSAQSGRIEYVAPVPSGPPSPPQPGSAVAIRALRADESLVVEFPVEVKLDSELGPGDARTGLVDAVLGLEPEVRVLELVVSGRVADTFRAAPQEPPSGGQARVDVEGDMVRLAVDPGPGAHPDHRYIVQASSDGGRTWFTLGVGLSQPTLDIDKNQFPPGSEVQLRVLATDGFSSSVVTTDTVKI